MVSPSLDFGRQANWENRVDILPGQPCARTASYTLPTQFIYLDLTPGELRTNYAMALPVFRGDWCCVVRRKLLFSNDLWRKAVHSVYQTQATEIK